MNFTNKHNLPKAYYNAVIQDDYKPYCDVSVTTLTGTPRMFWLKKRHDKEITVDVVDRLWAVYGRALHAMLAKHSGKDQIAEEQLVIKQANWKIGGTPDLFDETEISDWKNTSVWTVIYDANKIEYVSQLNLYRLLLNHHGFDQINSLKNIYILRDWSGMKAQNDPSYPQIALDVVSQEVWPGVQAANYLSCRVSAFQNCEGLKDNDLPLCTPAERWHTDDKYALIKEGRKSAIKLCGSMAEAEGMLKAGYKGATGIQARPGVDKRCQRYCECRAFCDYYKEMVKTDADEEN